MFPYVKPVVCGVPIQSHLIEKCSFLRAKAATAFSVSKPSQFCLSVCPSVTRVDQSKTEQATITESSPSTARKNLVSGTVKLFHKFQGGHPERGC